jgi:hypothetical protein
LDPLAFTYPGQCFLVVQSSLASHGAVSMAIGEKGASLVNAGVLVLKDCELVDFAERLEHVPQILLLEVSRNLQILAVIWIVIQSLFQPTVVLIKQFCL